MKNPLKTIRQKAIPPLTRRAPRLIALFVFLALSSCVRYRDLVNFSEAQLPYQQAEAIANQADLIIQHNDLLQITVSAGDGDAAKIAAAPFNPPISNNQNNMQLQQGITGQGTNALELFSGYFVDNEGKVDLPTLGAVPLGGLTLAEARQRLIGQLTPFLENPVVNIRFLNFKITVLGEVNVPGIVRLSNQRVTILEALGAAGDLTPYANRRNVLLMREQNGQRTFHRIDLMRGDIFTSPLFYLRQNDLIYIEPLQAKAATTADLVSRIISYTSAGLSLVTLIIALGK